MNPYVFVVGCPRSGTTLVKRMLEALPEIAIAGETHWISIPFKEGRGLTPAGDMESSLVDRIVSHPRFHKLGLTRAEIDQARAITRYAAFVELVFDTYAQRQGKRLAGDKTPSYARFITPLHAYWPRARFIHIIRDGRDVCLSLLNWSKAEHAAGRFETWEADRLLTSALRWDWNVRLAREAARKLPAGAYTEIRYESLVIQPEGAARDLCEFLDLGFDDAMLRFHEGRTRAGPGLDAKHAWLPVTAGLRDWRTQMEPPDVQRFQLAAGPLLEELGYETIHSRPSPGMLEQVHEIKERFARDARARGRALPAAWAT